LTEGWQLITIRGIPLRIHPSWFLILAVATMAFRQHYTTGLGGSGAGAATDPLGLWALALVTALLLFVSVLLHELGHSLVAISQGVRVKSITLFLLGGVASVERECSTALGSLLVAAAGPAVSLLLGLGLMACSHTATHIAPWLGLMVTELGTLNLVLALFNLLPGLPLDGGLIVKALVWQVSGSQRRGVEVANACGRLLASFAIGLGVLLLLRGVGVAGAWLLLLGWFGLGVLLVRNLVRPTSARPERASSRIFVNAPCSQASDSWLGSSSEAAARTTIMFSWNSRTVVLRPAGPSAPE
jgi:Zn-dependent protease